LLGTSIGTSIGASGCASVPPVNAIVDAIPPALAEVAPGCAGLAAGIFGKSMGSTLGRVIPDSAWLDIPSPSSNSFWLAVVKLFAVDDSAVGVETASLREVIIGSTIGTPATRPGDAEPG
jgi:hypothetical protein